MPEGPEIRYIANLCKKHLIGKTLENIVSNSDTKVKLPKKSKLKNVESKGKQMVLIFEDFWFCIHFGLTGWLTFEEAKYPRYELHFNDLTAYIDDSRRFSKLKIYESEQSYKKVLNKLGVDIFSDEFTEEFFIESFGKTKKAIVAFLMEQTKFCGIGNYIKNESLYLSGISPHRKTDKITDEEKSTLFKSILHVAYSNFVENIDLNKIKLDKKDLKRIKELKIKISSPYKFNVYGRDENDLKGNKLTVEDIGGRTCYYVKTLQH